VIPVPPPNTTLLNAATTATLPSGQRAPLPGSIYTTGQNFPLSQFQISNGVNSTRQVAKSNNTFPPRGGIRTVSANGTAGGVVWIEDYSGWAGNTPVILDTYDANDVGTLLFSSPATATTAAGPSVKCSVPTVANGRMYVSGQYVFTVFGLLPN
jgi:hypothetical protein